MIDHRISDAEAQIGAGLIEEVIQVAEGELKLVDTMVESKVYVLRPSYAPAALTDTKKQVGRA